MKKNIVHENESKEIPDICGKVLELLNQDNSNCKFMSIATILIRQGEESTKHFHKKMEEIYYIISGEAEITIDSHIKKVISGHAILIPVGAVHQIKNIGKETLKFISIDAPPYIESDVYLESN